MRRGGTLSPPRPRAPAASRQAPPVLLREGQVSLGIDLGEAVGEGPEPWRIWVPRGRRLPSFSRFGSGDTETGLSKAPASGISGLFLLVHCTGLLGRLRS